MQDRLTISFWVWGIFDMKSNPYYDDLERRFVELKERGFNVRVYVPFGSNWYPYLMRRLAERPGNIAFMTASVVKETFSRR